MHHLRKLQSNWEGFARLDPLWAICVDHGRLGNKWTQEDFFATGRLEISRVMQYLESLGLTPDRAGEALDFGCGVGRLTRALGSYFSTCWGVDISPTMIDLANTLNSSADKCCFKVNQQNHLRQFTNNRFAFVYTSIVLQHIPRKYVEGYLRELVRVLKPGGIFVFQAPEREKAPALAKLRNKIAFRRRLKHALRRETLAAFHMEMHCLSERSIREVLAGCPGRIIDIRLTNSSTGGFNGDLQFLDREPESGFVSKQYCLVKEG
ncbi:MAG TPA: class I SAM-dependent methyltransferase [Candidatus Angelobacter sp.]|nr:class I SAM-dependent methyltransferase [Candidatus Angelobacter sp.]